MGWWYGDWKPYVPVARRRADAAAYAARIAKKEKRTLAPVKIQGRDMARSFWGRAWCNHLECYSDFANRLPRGRTYARNGSVIDLQIERGVVKAIVSGSDIYHVTIKIKTLSAPAWKQIKGDCAASIASLIDLLQGRFDEGVMQRLTQPDRGLFPQPKEIDMDCTCPDWAGMCKHVAAVLYGVGARLDTAPELLFTLRNVDHLELIGQAVSAENLNRALAAGSEGALAESDLGELFGIDIDVADPQKGSPRRRAGQAHSAAPKTAKASVQSKAAAKQSPARAKGRARTAKPRKVEEEKRLPAAPPPEPVARAGRRARRTGAPPK
jgi:uncharacterized Zn finger protein